MSDLPPLFLDLAIILVTAGIITVVFKWLKQPLVLGYIVAGFFIGPYFPWFPMVNDGNSVHVWSEIGIVFLMFALGLEFSIKKLKKVGSTGAITALTELFLMFLIGSSVGRLLGWQSMDCIFLGCMLAISSTTIIIKSFDDLKLKQQKFTGTVTAVLVVEDIVAVLLLVLLNTISVSQHFDGAKLAFSLAKLVFSLVVWFVFGIYLIPTFLRWMRKYMTEETLCVVAVGLCFLMVVMASAAGFSTALGAFVMGAILAETIEADIIHKVISPIKNLFGAVFFVSVGMMVDPGILVRYVVPILIIAATVVVFKSMSATIGVFLSGKPARTAIQSGFCFCQIGEFSFIIAGVGKSFGVINPDLYPIIVSVSIITTFVTPYMIKAGRPFYEKVYTKLPARWREALDQYSNQSKGSEHGASLQKFVKKQLLIIFFYGIILTAISMISFFFVKPLLNGWMVKENGVPSFWGNLIGIVVTLVVMAPFLWAIAVKQVNKKRIKKLLAIYSHSRAVVIPLMLLRYFTALFFVGLVLGQYMHLALGFIFVLAVMVLITVMFSKRANGFYHRIEDRFVTNFNQRQAQQSFKIPESLEQNFLMERIRVTQYSPFVGVSLKEAGFRQRYGVNVVSVERAGKVYDLPDKDTIIMPLDRLTVIGAEDQLSRFRADADVEPEMLIHDHSDNELNIYRLVIVPDGPLCGKDFIRSEFQKTYNAMVIAIERLKEGSPKSDYMLNPPANTIFTAGDIVWFVSPEEYTIARFEKK